MEGSRDLGVELNRLVGLLQQLVVPRFHSFVDPLGKGVANQGESHVDEPLPRELAEVPRVGQVALHQLVLLGEAQDLPDAEALVLGAPQVLHLVTVDNYRDMVSAVFNLPFFVPMAMSLRKYTVTHSLGGR